MKDWLRNRKMITSTASEDFKSNIMEGKRYVDKTMLLVPLLNRDHETTFFLCPRRFGKTLTLSMIHYYVEDTRDPALNGENRSLFQGMKIMEAGNAYTSRMTAYPVIHLTFQTLAGSNFKEAYDELKRIIRNLYNDKQAILASESLTEEDTAFYRRILKDAGEKKATVSDYKNALKKMTEFLRKVYGRRTVVLIDEYDVPLETAYREGYYNRMVRVLGPLLQNVLKTNSINLQFAVITGCLRIAKEEIFTGLNNLEINTVLSDHTSDAIGFTETEVQWLLTESGFPDHFEEVRNWYNGYLFGQTVIYNPWSVIKHIEALSANPEKTPLPYWANTSENAIIRELAECADAGTREKIEKLLHGETISFALRDNIVYDNLFTNPDNVFNVMLSTGYLTAVSSDSSTVLAQIPNREVQKIFTDIIADWFNDSLKAFNVRELYAKMESGNVERMEEILNDSFLSSLSYYDTVEAFYHGVLLTLMQLNQSYHCTSNRESGNGRFDIQCRQKARLNLAFILEVKVSENRQNMLRDAQKGAAQIKMKRYAAELEREGYKQILTFGIAFCEKTCRIVQGPAFGTSTTAR